MGQNEFFTSLRKHMIDLLKESGSAFINSHHPLQVKNQVRHGFQLGAQPAQHLLHGAKEKISLKLVDANLSAFSSENRLLRATPASFGSDRGSPVAPADHHTGDRAAAEHMQLEALRELFAHLNASATVALFIQKRRECPDAELSRQNRDNATAD